jgi:hypothetical protein
MKEILCFLVAWLLVATSFADEGLKRKQGNDDQARGVVDQQKFDDAKAARSAELKNRKTRGRELSRQKEYNKRIANEWAIFARRFENRTTVPIYSGNYLIGSKVVVTPNYEAIAAYQRELEVRNWNAMSDQQKRDMALFVIANNTGAIAANTGRIADAADGIVGQLHDIKGKLDDLEQAKRREEIDRIIRQEWPLPN